MTPPVLSFCRRAGLLTVNSHYAGCLTLKRAINRQSSASSRSASTSTVDLFLHEYGPKDTSTSTPVVFIHGLLGSGTNFRTYQLKVAAHRPTIAVDLRNHGKSAHTNGPMTLEMLAADVEATIRHLYGGRPVDIVGHSLGGKTAMTLALSQPSLISRLVVVDIAPVSYNTQDPQWKNVDAIVRAANDLKPEQYANRAEVDRELAKAVSDPGVRSFVAQNLMPRPDGRYTWRINLGSIRDSMYNFSTFPAPPASPPNQSFPVHFIAGSKSSYIKEHHLPAIRARFPAAHVHSIEGAGHWVHADKPTEFWNLLARLLGVPAA